MGETESDENQIHIKKEMINCLGQLPLLSPSRGNSFVVLENCIIIGTCCVSHINFLCASNKELFVWPDSFLGYKTEVNAYYDCNVAVY